jgi:hypothetical protein
MTASRYSLEQDLRILGAMASELKDYLLKDILYWRLEGPASFPLMTLGGYLLRLHRAEALMGRPEPAGHEVPVQSGGAALRDARREFENQTRAWARRAATKYQQELDARLKLLGEYLGELETGAAAAGHWPHEAEIRTMIALLLDAARASLEVAPYETRVRALDVSLERRLEPSDFVGDPALEIAYPRETFWWMWRRPGIG